MKDKTWTLLLALGLILLSIALYTLHLLVFHDPHHILIYGLGDIAFIPLEVLIVTLILHRLLERRDRRNRMEKMNMVIGTFFSVAGTWLLRFLQARNPDLDPIRGDFVITDAWTDADFSRIREALSVHSCRIKLEAADLGEMRDFLVSRGDFLIRLLENPVLLEHEAFTSLLRAVFHLTEELGMRGDLGALPEHDRAHLAGDSCRIYELLVPQWLEYMLYLKKNYPYLFSLALRTNPFDATASPIIP